MDIVTMRDGQRIQSEVFVSKFVLITLHRNAEAKQYGDWSVVLEGAYPTEREARRVSASFGRGIQILPVSPYNYARGIGPVEMTPEGWMVAEKVTQ